MPLLKKKRVLLLDDDPSMQRLVTTVLRRAGFRVEAFLTGKDAIAALNTNEYDAILLDLMMPHEGGVTVMRHLRRSDPAMLQRVIIVTGSPDSVTKRVSSDVRAVVKKPFQPAELIRVVKDVTA
jgi:DNA-binding response OmpR family regulator